MTHDFNLFNLFYAWSDLRHAKANICIEYLDDGYTEYLFFKNGKQLESFINDTDNEPLYTMRVMWFTNTDNIGNADFTICLQD